MADLDDFFAKKDKKKSKAKPKFLTADELVKKLEDTSKREASAAVIAKSKKSETLTTNNVAPVVAEGAGGDDPPKAAGTEQVNTQEEEWKEFEEEQRKDYSGLKIGRLTLNDDDDDSTADGDDDEGDEENGSGNENPKRVGGSGGGGAGVWKKVIPAEEVTQIPIEVEKPSNKGVYISPALRAAGGMSGASKLKARRAAPDITNADYFPTLGAARPEEQRKKKNEPAFEEVRHGGRMQRVQEKPIAPANVANRFQSLDDEDS